MWCSISWWDWLAANEGREGAAVLAFCERRIANAHRSVVFETDLAVDLLFRRKDRGKESRQEESRPQESGQEGSQEKGSQEEGREEEVALGPFLHALARFGGRTAPTRKSRAGQPGRL